MLGRFCMSVMIRLQEEHFCDKIQVGYLIEKLFGVALYDFLFCLGKSSVRYLTFHERTEI